MIFIMIPLTLWLSVKFLDTTKYMITSLLVILYTMLPFFMIYEKRRPKAREIVLLAVMTAITAFAHIVLHLAAVPIGTGACNRSRNFDGAGSRFPCGCVVEIRVQLLPGAGSIHSLADVLLGTAGIPCRSCI